MRVAAICDRGPARKRSVRAGLLTLCIILAIATSAAASSDPLILEHADSSRIELQDEGARSHFYHPRFRQGDTRLTSDYALFDEAIGRAWLRGSVVMLQPGRYLTTDSVVYERDTRTAIAVGSTVVVDTAEGIILTSERATMARAEERVIADSLPYLITDFLLDSTMWTRITGDTLIFDRGDKHGTAIGDVTVRREDWVTTAGRAEIWTDSNIAVLTQAPVGRGDRSMLAGDSLTIRFTGSAIEQALAVGHGRGAYGFSNRWLDSLAQSLEQVLRPPDTLTQTDSDTASRPTTTDPRAGAAVNLLTTVLDTLFGYTSLIETPSPEPNDTSASDEDSAPAVIDVESADSLFEIHRLQGHRVELQFDHSRLQTVHAAGQATVATLPRIIDPDRGRNTASGDSLRLTFDTTGALTYARIDGAARGVYRTPNLETTATDTITYRSETIEVFPGDERIVLTGNADAKYGAVQLTAGTITYRPQKRSLWAAWTEPADSVTGRSPDRPLLTDVDQTVTGDTLTYNIDTRRGRIRDAHSVLEGAYHSGEQFRKYTDDIFFVEDGIYTSCDRPKPHWRFESRSMKIIRGDKVIARPVVLKLGELPTLRVPYYIFPIKPGRHSGLLPIRFGNFNRGRRFVNNVGYYWAASDYVDWEGALDYHEEHGVLFRTTARYALRYILNGSVSGSYSRESNFTGQTRSRSTRWELRGKHSQTLSPTARLTGSGEFISDRSFYTDFSPDVRERRNRQIRSFLSFSKKFSGSSLTMAVENVNNLDTEQRNRRLPDMNFRTFTRPIFKPDSGQDRRWYHNFYVNYSTHGVHRQELSIDVDSSETEKRFAVVDNAGGISFQQKLLKHITLSNRLALQETWYYVFDTDVARDAGVLTENGARRLSGRYSASANGTLYGFLRPNLFGLNAIRHAMTPSVSFALTPPVTRHDDLRQYTRTGGGSSRRLKTISLSLNNVFDAKLGDGPEARKQSLFNIGLGTSYNFEADTRKWSKLSGNLRTTLTRKLDLSADATWDLYDRETLDLQWHRPRLERFGISAGATITGARSAFSSVTQTGGGMRQVEGGQQPSRRRPFNGSISYRYQESKVGTRSKTHWIGWRADFSPTENWTVSYNQTYRMDLHRTTQQEIALSRDLHCWQGRFSWVPLGSRRGYYFLLQVKAIPDIKYERSESGLRGNLF